MNYIERLDRLINQLIDCRNRVSPFIGEIDLDIHSHLQNCEEAIEFLSQEIEDELQG